MIAGFPFITGRPLWSGLAAFYKLDNLNDSSGNGNTLTNIGGVDFVVGKIGDAAEFDGANYLESESVNLSELTELTICFWVRHEDSENNVLNEAAGDWDAGVGPIVIAFGGLGQYKLYGYSTLGVAINTEEEFTVLDATPRNSDWRFIAIRYTGTSLQLKTNNEGWITTAVTGALGLAETNGYFRMGDGGDNVPIAEGGNLDAFGIWKRSLSDAEISLLYNNGNGREI